MINPQALRLQDIQGLLRVILQNYLQPGDLAIDATAGRGRDTLFLAECVGDSGLVHAFDIQPAALAQTRDCLTQKGWEKRVVLHLLDHARMAEAVEGPVSAVIFNLGYLPGSSHEIRTEAASTLAAVQAALGLLRVRGVLAMTVYRAHPGGEEEATEVEKYLIGLPAGTFSVLKGGYINQISEAPYWILVERKGRNSR